MRGFIASATNQENTLPIALVAIGLLLSCQADPAKAQIRAEGQEVLAIKASPDMTKADAEISTP